MLHAFVSLMSLVPGAGYNRTLSKKNFVVSKEHINAQDHTALIRLKP